MVLPKGVRLSSMTCLLQDEIDIFLFTTLPLIATRYKEALLANPSFNAYYLLKNPMSSDHNTNLFKFLTIPAHIVQVVIDCPAVANLHSLS